MAGDEQKLNTHFNIAMTVVSVAKAAYYLSEPQAQGEVFFEPVISQENFLQLCFRP